MQNKFMIVKRPLITEKSLALAAKSFYTFSVAASANKAEISREIGILYKVKVTGIRTVSMHGKVRRVGRKMNTVRKSDWKKAIVKLAPGQKIEAFEVTTKEEKK